VLQALEGENVAVACIGGGPGTDVLGMAMALELKRKHASIQAKIIDAVDEWADCWSQISPRLGTRHHIEAEYVQPEITSGPKAGLAHRVSGVRVYSMSYCLAEVYARKGEAERFFSELFDSMAPGSFLVFVDNAYSGDFEWFDAMARAAALEMLDASNYIGGITISSTDKAIANECYHGKLTRNNPHLNPDHCFRICRNP
jgi:hypothetical protein